jgi:hypothetical protein
MKMASSRSHNNNNNSIPLVTLLEWYKIRDTMFGDNYERQNILLALLLAAVCKHPDARWLTEACAGKDVNTAEDAKRVFSALGSNDARALCFLWMCGSPVEQEDLTTLRRAADLGFALAQALLCWRLEGEELKFAELAAAQGERDGFYWLGRCWHEGNGCEMDFNKAKENFLRASELGDVAAMDLLGNVLDDSDPQRWRWWGQAAASGLRWSSFLSNFDDQVELFNSGSGSAAVVFAIGRALHGHVNEEARTIFNDFVFDTRIGPAKQAVSFYELQVVACRRAMDEWSKVGIHFGVVKDIRRLISKLIWDSREQALFNVLREYRQGLN